MFNGGLKILLFFCSSLNHALLSSRQVERMKSPRNPLPSLTLRGAQKNHFKFVLCQAISRCLCSLSDRKGAFFSRDKSTPSLCNIFFHEDALQQQQLLQDCPSQCNLHRLPMPSRDRRDLSLPPLSSLSSQDMNTKQLGVGYSRRRGEGNIHSLLLVLQSLQKLFQSLEGNLAFLYYGIV